MQIEFVIAL